MTELFLLSSDREHSALRKQRSIARTDPFAAAYIISRFFTRIPAREHLAAGPARDGRGEIGKPLKLEFLPIVIFLTHALGAQYAGLGPLTPLNPSDLKRLLVGNFRWRVQF